MLIIGYAQVAPAAIGGAATITALPAQTAASPSSPLFSGTTAAHDFSVDISGISSSQRCLLVAWGWDLGTTAAFGNFWLNGVTNLGSIVKTSSNDGVRTRVVSIGQWTKGAESSPATFTPGFNSPVQAIGFQLFKLSGVHASTATDSKSNTAVGTNSIALATALSTAANGVALFACAQGDGAALTGSWTATPFEETDQSLEQYLQIHAASYQTDGTALNPTLTFSGTMDDACIAAVSIPPA